MSTLRSSVVIRFMRLRSMPSKRWKIFEKRPTVSKEMWMGRWGRGGNHEETKDNCGFRIRNKEKRLFNFSFQYGERKRTKGWCGERNLNVWLLRCCRELVAAPSGSLDDDSLLISVLMRLIFKICKSSLTALCCILKVFAQSKISCTVMSAELLSCVLLVNNSSNGSSFMFINSSTCWWSSLVRVMVIGTETTEVGVGDGGTSCVLLVMMIVSLALRFFKFMFCCLLIGVIVISLFSISLRI